MSGENLDIPDQGTDLVVVEHTESEVVPRGNYTGGNEDVMAFRDQLVKKYHRGSVSLIDRLKQDGSSGYEPLLVALIDEVIKETDHLLGNELIATTNGELRDASAISFRRSEVLEKAIKAVQSKQQFERSSTGIDIDGPAMQEIFRYFMTKVKDTFEKIGMPNEMRDLFFRSLSCETIAWKKELREQLDFLDARNG